MQCAPLENLGECDCVLFVTDHYSSYDHGKAVADSQLVVDTPNATKGLGSEKIVRC